MLVVIPHSAIVDRELKLARFVVRCSYGAYDPVLTRREKVAAAEIQWLKSELEDSPIRGYIGQLLNGAYVWTAWTSDSGSSIGRARICRS